MEAEPCLIKPFSISPQTHTKSTAESRHTTTHVRTGYLMHCGCKYRIPGTHSTCHRMQPEIGVISQQVASEEESGFYTFPANST